MIKLRVKEVLREKGITQKDFASKLGMSEVGLSKSINENGNPDLKRLNEISDALGVPVTELFEHPSTDIINCPNCGAKLRITKD